MKTIVIATAIVMSFAGMSLVDTAALAQSNAGSTSGGTSATGSAITAPVGHRQPKRADVPEISTDQARNDAADRELDRKIRSICRGC